MGENIKQVEDTSKLQNVFSNFSCMFLNPNNFFEFEFYLL